MIGRLPGTPPGRPKGSQNLPEELPRTLRALRGRPGRHETVGKSTKKQRQFNRTYKKSEKFIGTHHSLLNKIGIARIR